ncbi:MAG: prolyl oligopeptidase family serine peptidase [Candidatus Nanopelagicales bacterium]
MSLEDQAWRRRFQAPVVGFPQWSDKHPDRLVFTSNEGGTTQVWTLDRTSGVRRQVTNQRVGVEEMLLTPDARAVVWWQDDSGNENGQWVTTSLDSGNTEPLLPDAMIGWSQGIALAESTVALALTDGTSYRLFASVAGESPRLLRESTKPLGLGREWETTEGGLSTDGALVCYRNSDQGDMLHFGLRIVDATSGKVVDELLDEGLTLKVAAWSPIAGDQRLVVIHERDGIERPALWEPGEGALRDYSLDLPGPVDVAGWYPDASALLVLHEHEGRRQLFRLELDSAELNLVHDPMGWISGAAVRPDGEIWFRDEAAERSPVVRITTGEVVLAPPGASQPAGRPHQSLRFPIETGETAHMMLGVPSGQAPFPVVMMVHGGPEWAYPDDFDPWELALVDAGYLVGKVNYRGSTGGSVGWRTALHAGNIGFPEVADVVSGLDHLVAQGLADPDRAAIEGWSWGGYVSLLAIGLHPEKFAAAVGGIPVCDSVMTHEDCSPPQQAYDLAIMGGSPSDLPELYAERSPSSYVDRVKTPVLLIAGEHDSACPIRQVRFYASELRKRGRTVQLHVYDAGHHANSVDEQIQHAELELAFLAENLRA